MNVTIANDRHGDPEAHRAGCRHLTMRSKGYTDPYDIVADSVDDITFEVWGASLVATDRFDGDHRTEPDRYRQFTIAEYSGCVHIAPCLKDLKESA